MATDTDISNMAIGHLGMAGSIANLSTERSAQAIVCRRFYETVRQATLRNFPWPRARKFATLGLVSLNPTDTWLFAYQVPSDSLKFRRILNGAADPESPNNRIPYVEVMGSPGTLIYTNQENAVGEYTVDVTDTSQYPSDLLLAMSLHLSIFIAPALTKGDPFKRQGTLMQLYQAQISIAEANALGEEQQPLNPDAEMILGRNS